MRMILALLCSVLLACNATQPTPEPTSPWLPVPNSDLPTHAPAPTTIDTTSVPVPTPTTQRLVSDIDQLCEDFINETTNRQLMSYPKAADTLELCMDWARQQQNAPGP